MVKRNTVLKLQQRGKKKIWISWFFGFPFIKYKQQDIQFYSNKKPIISTTNFRNLISIVRDDYIRYDGWLD